MPLLDLNLLSDLEERIGLGELIPPTEYPLFLQIVQAARRLRICELSLRGALRQRDALMKLSKAQDCLVACYRADANPGRMSEAVDRVERCREEFERAMGTLLVVES